jgi:hypothetical protein
MPLMHSRAERLVSTGWEDLTEEFALLPEIELRSGRPSGSQSLRLLSCFG